MTLSPKRQTPLPIRRERVRCRAVRYVDWSAYCSEDGCSWSTSAMTAKSQARRHAEKTGHRVEVFGEKFFVIKPIKQEDL